MNSNRIKKWTIIGTSAALGVSLSTGIAYAATNTPGPTHPTPQQTVTNTTQHRTSSPGDLGPRFAHSTKSTHPRDHWMDRDRRRDRTPYPSADRHDRYRGDYRNGCRDDHHADRPGRHTEYRYHADRNGAWMPMGHHGTDHGHGNGWGNGWGDHQ
jgi:hypothetical protein